MTLHAPRHTLPEGYATQDTLKLPRILETQLYRILPRAAVAVAAASITQGYQTFGWGEAETTKGLRV
jgi:hypothetical protein